MDRPFGTSLQQELNSRPHPLTGNPHVSATPKRRKSFSTAPQVSEHMEDSNGNSQGSSLRSSSQPALRMRTLHELFKPGAQAEDHENETRDLQTSEHLRSPSSLPDSSDTDLRQKLAQLARQQALHPNMEALLKKGEMSDSSSPTRGNVRTSSQGSDSSQSPRLVNQSLNSPWRRNVRASSQGSDSSQSPRLVHQSLHSPLRRNVRASSQGSDSPLSPLSPRQVQQMVGDPDSPRIRGNTRLGTHEKLPSLAQMDDLVGSRSPQVRSRRPSFDKGPLPMHQDIADDQSERSVHTPAGSTCNSRRPSRILDASELANAVDVHTALKAEKDRDANQVSSRAYNDEDHSCKSAKGASASLKLEQSCFFENSGQKPRRTMKVLRAGLEMGQATIVVTWLLTVIISLFIALQSAGLLVMSRSLQTWRLHAVEVAVSERSSEWLAFLILLAYALLSTLVASCLVCEAPRAQGSGIPDMKAFLNGNHIPHLFSFKTWFVRGLGLVLVTSSGLSAGTEGPCGHLGAIASRGLAKSLFTLLRGSLPTFGHRSCCEFVAMGCAVGVASAFSAPVGGILFAMEEASSFWNKGLTLRSFVGSMLAAAVVKAAKVGFRELPSSGFIEFPDPTAGFDLGELLPFCVISIGTSLLGALFCTCVEKLTRLRLRFYRNYTRRTKKTLQVFEALTVASITMVICFWVPLAFGCSRLSEHTDDSAWSVGKHARIVCPHGHYSDIGTVLLERRETAIKALFTASFDGNAEFGTGRLFFSAAIVFFLTVLTYGTALPVGLFVPNILVGACFGRGIGQIWISMGFKSHPGVHALMGAAGMLAGFGRMAVSLTMIILEITSSTKLLLPVMMCILISKALADCLTESVYDVSIKYQRDISVIKGELDDEDMPLLRYLTVHDACSTEIQTLKCEEQPERILATLTQTSFSGFPVVTENDHQVVGLILRSQLMDLLQETENFCTDIAGRSTIKLLKYADIAPEVKHWNTPLARAHRHFAAAGLRHLCIVDETHRLLGILTRSDLAPLSNPRTRRKALGNLYNRKNLVLHGGMLDIEGSKYLSYSKDSASSGEENLSDTTSCASSSIFPLGRSCGPRWAAY